MKYLFTKNVLNQEQYYELEENDQKKIEALFALNPRPKSFILHAEEIQTDEVIGFTDDKPKEALGLHSMEDLGNWVKQQPWYRPKAPEQSALPIPDQT